MNILGSRRGLLGMARYHVIAALPAVSRWPGVMCVGTRRQLGERVQDCVARGARAVLGLLLWLTVLVSMPVVAGTIQDVDEAVSDAAVLSIPPQAQDAAGDAPGADDGADAAEGDVDAVPELSEEERERQQRLLAQAAALRARLDELDRVYGTYDPALIEVQHDLGRVYLELGQFDEAVEYLAETLQRVRVNHGLYSEQQVPVLSQLIEAHQGQQGWEEADDYQHLLFAVQARVHEAGSEEYVDALIALSGWRLHAARNNLLARGGAQYNVSLLLDLQDQQERALEAAREREHVRQQWDLLYSRALTDIEMARQLNYRSLMDFVEPNEPRYVTRTVCSMVPDGANGVRRVCWNQTVNNPEYYRSANDQRRNYLERARSRVQSSLRQLDELLADNPDFAATHQADTQSSMEAIQQVAADIQRDARRAAMRRW